MFLKSQTVRQNGLGAQPFPDGLCGRTGLSSSALLRWGPISNIEDKVRRILPKIGCFFCLLDWPQLDPSSSLEDTPNAFEA